MSTLLVCFTAGLARSLLAPPQREYVFGRERIAAHMLLLGVTLVPFPTSLVAEYLQREGAQSAAIVFNGTYIFIALAFNLLWRTAAVNDRLLHHDADRAATNAIFEAYRDGPIWYVLAFVLAFVTVTGSLLLNLALAVYFAWPSKTGLTSSDSRRHLS